MLCRGALDELVKYVKIPLSGVPHHHPRFFQKEVGDLSTIWFPTWTELDFKVFSKSAGVVVPDGLGVPEGFQQWVGLQDDVLDMLDLRASPDTLEM